MGCGPSQQHTAKSHHTDMIIQDLKMRKDPWSLSFQPSVEYDPWEGSVEKSASSSQSKSVRIISGTSAVSIVDLRSKSDVIKASLSCDNVFKNSECQTEKPEGVDFDWDFDLTDKIDIETQTSPSTWADSSISEPLDVIVQTDQRIVFPATKRRARVEDSNKTEKTSSSSQTWWEVSDQEIQVLVFITKPLPA